MKSKANDSQRVISVPYIGRFAPSPTGPLHFGSAVAAIASYLDARANQGTWLIRIEDLDPPRELPGAAEQILDQLAAIGLQSDLPITFQSERHDLYQAALEDLRNKGYLFLCGCTRREIGNAAYPGTCRGGLPAGKTGRSERFKVPTEEITFIDAYYGTQSERLSETIGDFNLVRADGLFSYHLAVVVDDAEQLITHVVRGEDLLTSTARQIAVQRALDYRTPQFRHFPVVRDDVGVKLSKQTGAKQVDTSSPERVWRQVLKFLDLANEQELRGLSLPQIIDTAIKKWRIMFECP